MQLMVDFKEYRRQKIDYDTGEEERGRYIGSFSQEIEGIDLGDIMEKARWMAKEWSEDHGTDIHWKFAIDAALAGIPQ